MEQDPGLIDVKSKSFTQFGGGGGDSRVGEGFDSSATWYRGVRAVHSTGRLSSVMAETFPPFSYLILL